MQIRTIRKVLKRSNANSNPSKWIRSILIQIQTVWKGFEAFQSKFESLESHWGIWVQIPTFRKGFEEFECKF